VGAALLRLWPSPVVRLNRPVAIGFREGPRAGLTALARLLDGRALAAYGYLSATRADLLRRLADAQRPGRPRRFTPVQRAQVTAIACELPVTRGMPLSRWSSFELACEAIEAGVVVDISASTVRRWLAADALKPWQYRSWIAPRAPDFAAKAEAVLDLYARVWDGEPLGRGDYVLCSDEKTSVQARCRCHPTLAPGLARMMRVEHEYDRGGALAYLAAWDVHRGKVFGRCEPSTGIAPFSRLVRQLMSIEPYASADRVFWVVECATVALLLPDGGERPSISSLS
jgi:hypothetical protein